MAIVNKELRIENENDYPVFKPGELYIDTGLMGRPVGLVLRKIEDRERYEVLIRDRVERVHVSWMEKVY